MPQTNKGFKMLTKMGWNEGEKLGKDNRGLLEPVSTTKKRLLQYGVVVNS